MFALKPFQEKALTDLRTAFLNLWKRGDYQLPLVFWQDHHDGSVLERSHG
jgi:hypothetical protein